ncbi:MAG: glycosyltransferase family 4 protein [Planctomycetota bacterium]|jgi:glycosyltransferase involved in cell wall biosynthesis
MKMLFVTLLLPHPYADHASAFTVFKVIKHLSRRHDISLISFVFSEKEKELARYVGQYCRRVETVLVHPSILKKLWVRMKLLTLMPMVISYAYSRKMKERIRYVLKQDQFDIVELEYTPMGQYVSEIGDLPVVLAIQDVLYIVAKRFVNSFPNSRKRLEWLIDGLLCRRYEPRLLAKFNHVITVSQKNREQLLSRNPRLKISAVPPGVDIPQTQKSHTPGQGRALIFMGGMWRPHNVDAVLYFFHTIFGLIRKEVPDTLFYVVGGSPSSKVKQLASDPSVTVTGYVKDILPYYLKCDVSVVPMRIAGGIMCKVLDAMAAGLPVVSTSQGNEGVGARAEEEIILADDPVEFAERTVELLRDGRRRKLIGQKGLEFVRRNFGWDKIIEHLETVYQEILSSP